MSDREEMAVIDVRGLGLPAPVGELRSADEGLFYTRRFRLLFHSSSATVLQSDFIPELNIRISGEDA